MGSSILCCSTINGCLVVFTMLVSCPSTSARHPDQTDTVDDGVQISVDTTGAEAFLRLCRKGRMPSATDVQHLLDHPAYQILIEKSGPNVGLPDPADWHAAFAHALAPSAYPLKRELREHWFAGKMVTSLGAAAQRCESLTRYVESFKSEGASEEITKLVRPYVPPKSFSGQFQIKLLFFGPNAFGIKGEIIADAALLQCLGPRANELLAHELHHILREKTTVEFSMPDRFADIQQAFFWFESEGTADLMSYSTIKQCMIDHGYAKSGAWDRIEKEVNTRIAALSKLMRERFEGGAEGGEESPVITSLREEAAFHTIGYTMARRIVDVLGTNALCDVVGNPLGFLQAYQRAVEAKPQGGQQFVAFDTDVVLRIARASANGD